MEGMALGQSPVRTLGCLAAHRTNARKYADPSTAEGKAACFFHGTKLLISLETKGGGETNGGTKIPFRHGGKEENWAGKAPRGGLLDREALYGWLGAGMTTLGTGRRREERQANPKGARPKPGVLTIKPGMSFCFMGSCSRLHLRLRIQDVTREEAQHDPIPRKRRRCTPRDAVGAGGRGG
jgi:hypothetical protein